MHSCSLFDVDRFNADGYAVVAGVLADSDVAAARIAADELFAVNGGARAGARDPVLRHAVLREIARLPMITNLARLVLKNPARVVRSILFDKTPDSNWDVAWHQDVTIAVQEKHDVAGFGPWSTKRGVVCVQPPAAVLEGMVTIRLHLDLCGPDNGPLLVVPGSHRRGVLRVQNLDVDDCDQRAIACVAGQGAAVVMRPLTLHASKKSNHPTHRRVLHLDFAADDLPPPLRWKADGERSTIDACPTA